MPLLQPTQHIRPLAGLSRITCSSILAAPPIAFLIGKAPGHQQATKVVSDGFERGILNKCHIRYCELCERRALINAFFVPQGENVSTPKQSYSSENSLGALAYIALIPAVFFLLVPRYKKSAYVRFHAWQAIGIAVATVVITYALTLTTPLGLFVYMGFTLLAWIGLAFTCWLCGMMALRGKIVRLPIIGAWAESAVKSTFGTCSQTNIASSHPLRHLSQ